MSHSPAKKRRRTSKSKQDTAMAVARKALKKVERLEQAVETKKKLGLLDFEDISYDGYRLGLLDISLGNDRNNRIGREIFCTRFRFQGAVALGGTSTDSMIRVICVLYYGDTVDGTRPRWEDLMTVNSGSNTAIHAFYETELEGRYKVLYDQLHTVSTAWRPVINFSINAPINEKVNYRNNSDEPQNTQIALIAISSQNTNLPQLVGRHAVYFVDS